MTDIIIFNDPNPNKDYLHSNRLKQLFQFPCTPAKRKRQLAKLRTEVVHLKEINRHEVNKANRQIRLKLRKYKKKVWDYYKRLRFSVAIDAGNLA
jgi:hypothetical protein